MPPVDHEPQSTMSSLPPQLRVCYPRRRVGMFGKHYQKRDHSVFWRVFFVSLRGRDLVWSGVVEAPQCPACHSILRHRADVSLEPIPNNFAASHSQLSLPLSQDCRRCRLPSAAGTSELEGRRRTPELQGRRRCRPRQEAGPPPPPARREATQLAARPRSWGTLLQTTGASLPEVNILQNAGADLGLGTIFPG